MFRRRKQELDEDIEDNIPMDKIIACEGGGYICWSRHTGKPVTGRSRREVHLKILFARIVEAIGWTFIALFAAFLFLLIASLLLAAFRAETEEGFLFGAIALMGLLILGGLLRD